MANRVIAAKLLKMKKAKRLFPRYLSAEAVSVSRYDANHPQALGKRRFRAPDITPGDSDIRISNKKLREYARQVGMPFERAVEIVEELNQQREEQLGLDSNEHFVDNQPPVRLTMEQAKAALKAQPTARKPNMDKARGAEASRNQKLKRPDKTFARPEFYEPKETITHEMLVGRGVTIVDGQPTEEEMLLSGWSNWRRQGKTLFVRMNVVERNNYTLDLWFYQDKVYYFELDYNKKIGRRSRNYFSVNRAQKEMDHIRWVESIPI